MRKIEVIYPFAVHDDVVNKHFSAGETYELTEAEFNHKFIQACLKAGRAREIVVSLVPKASKKKSE